MRLIEPPDTHYLSSAIGWLELGNHLESNLELHRIDPLLRSHPDVMEVRWRIYAKAKWWEAALDLSQAIIRLAPGRVTGHLYRAQSLRRVKGLMAAWMSLLPLAETFPNEPLVCYYLACFGCQMGNTERAREWLGKAAQRSSQEKAKEQLRQLAQQDVDLEMLWPELSALGLAGDSKNAARQLFL